MSNLSDKKCVPCEGGVLPFDISDIHKYQKKLMVGILLKMKKKFFFYINNLSLIIF